MKQKLALMRTFRKGWRLWAKALGENKAIAERQIK